MTDKKTIYISFDVETDGPNILLNSCIMLGIAVSKPLDEITSFENEEDWTLLKQCWCIKKVGNTHENKKTIEEFWSKNKELYNHIKLYEISPATVSTKLDNIIYKLEDKYKLVYVARPTSFDIPWVKTILDYIPSNTLSHTGLCISTMLKVCDYIGIDRDVINKVIRNDKLPHTHYADDDALQQLYMFLQLKNFLQNCVVS
jgi:hypothetical protein